jgi:hypothetical protein
MEPWAQLMALMISPVVAFRTAGVSSHLPGPGATSVVTKKCTGTVPSAAQKAGTGALSTVTVGSGVDVSSTLLVFTVSQPLSLVTVALMLTLKPSVGRVVVEEQL